MRKFGIVVLGLALGGALAGGGVALASSSSPQITTAQTIRLLEHDTHQGFVDLNHNHRPDTGDQFIFAGVLTNPSTHKQAGSVTGACTVTFGQNALCQAIGTLNGRGQVTISGISGNAKDFDLAVTGGTGQFQNARGQIHIHQVNDTDSVDTLHLIP